MRNYYKDKTASLKDIFGTDDIALRRDCLEVRGKKYPIVNDVVILTEPSQYTSYVRRRLAEEEQGERDGAVKDFAEDIQYTFGEEWKSYSGMLPEHEQEFKRYFDLIDLSSLAGKRVCDLGCGMGRWSYFLKGRCKEMVLVDFSDAIFMARQTLTGDNSSLFFMCDIKQMPFRDDFADCIFSLGVLHHLPTPCLDEVRALKRYAPELLVFLYYALDNRPLHYRAILRLVTLVRTGVCRVRSHAFREVFALLGAYFLYLPLILLGKVLRPFKLSSHVPLYDFYHDKSMHRIEQDVYDRFFTRIEQRVARKDIEALRDTFSNVTVSDAFPYWHFVCRR